MLGQQAIGDGFVQVLTGAKLNVATSVTLGGTGSLLTVGPDASVEIGGKGGAHANELRIDAAGLLVGHGVINVGTLVNHGKIEAHGGALVLNARIDPASSGAVKIDALAHLQVNAGKIAGVISGEGSLIKAGGDAMELSATNTYEDGTELNGGTLDLAARGSAGTGATTFGSGAQTLRIEKAALSHHKFGNEIDAFGAGDYIELPGLKFVKGAKATYKANSHSLKVVSGKETDKFTLVNPESTKFKVVKDGKDSVVKLVVKKGALELANDPHSDRHHSAGGRMLSNFVPPAAPSRHHDVLDTHHSGGRLDHPAHGSNGYFQAAPEAGQHLHGAIAGHDHGILTSDLIV